MKRPNLRGSKKQAFGDNIYHQVQKTGQWRQENSHHSFEDGRINKANVIADTRTDRVLISDDFVYWGGVGPAFPARFLNYGTNHVSICVGRNHKNNFPPVFVHQFVAWLRAFDKSGFLGDPLDWRSTP